MGRDTAMATGLAGTDGRATDGPLGLYVHVPFCATACDFCAFYQEAPKRRDIEAYLRALDREAAYWAQRLHGRRIDTVFWGGGTPGLLTAHDIEAVGNCLRRHLPLTQVSEWTVEMAPSTVKADKLNALRALGVDRISLGVQSFDAEMLSALGRRHAPETAQQAWQRIIAAGFSKTNIDLMFALPGQDEAGWLRDLHHAMALEPGHLSTYCLTIEEDTALYVKLARGQLRRDLDQEADLYLRTWQTLADNGYMQYEVSNFARPGQECRHNVHTWLMHEWVGLGPSAASQFMGLRHKNTPDVHAWCQQMEGGVPTHEEEVVLTPAILAADALGFGLRMNRGVDLRTVEARFPHSPLAACEPLWQSLAAEGLLLRQGSRLLLTDQGRLLADAVAAVILEAL